METRLKGFHGFCLPQPDPLIGQVVHVRMHVDNVVVDRLVAPEAQAREPDDVEAVQMYVLRATG